MCERQWPSRARPRARRWAGPAYLVQCWTARLSTAYPAARRGDLTLPRSLQSWRCPVFLLAAAAKVFAFAAHTSCPACPSLKIYDCRVTSNEIIAFLDAGGICTFCGALVALRYADGSTNQHLAQAGSSPEPAVTSLEGGTELAGFKVGRSPLMSLPHPLPLA